MAHSPPYQKKGFRDASTNGKLAGRSVFNTKSGYFEEN